MAKRRKKLDEFGSSDEAHVSEALKSIDVERDSYQRLLARVSMGDCQAAMSSLVEAVWFAGDATAHIGAIADPASREHLTQERKYHRDIAVEARSSFKNKCVVHRRDEDD